VINVGTLAASQIGGVSAVTINVGTLAASQIGSVSATAIVAGTLSAGVVYAGNLNASQITGGTISASISITAPNITSRSGTVDEITLTGGKVTSNYYNGSFGGGILVSSILAAGNLSWGGSFGAGYIGISGLSLNNGVVIADGSSRYFNVTTTGTNAPYRVNATAVIDYTGAFVGAGVNCPSNGVGCSGVNIYSGGWYYGATSTSLTLVTDVRTNSGVLEKKTRTFDIRGGVITSVGTESAWTTASNI
jgi:hypothetical protein